LSRVAWLSGASSSCQELGASFQAPRVVRPPAPSSWPRLPSGPPPRPHSGRAMEAAAQRGAALAPVLEPPQRRDALKAAEVLKRYLRLAMERHVLAAKNRPALFSLAADGTPLLTQKRVVAQAKGGAKVVRSGGESEEYLIMQGLLRTRRADGTPVTVVLARDPLPLTEGKTADAVFAACEAFAPTLRQVGHRGLCIQHYEFDRALNAPLQRRFAQRHAALARAGPSAPAAGADALLPLLEWVASSGCAAHDVHNSLKWGLATHLGGAEGLKDLYIVCESFRNGYAALVSHIGKWLCTRLKFVEQPMPAALLQQAWGALLRDPRRPGPALERWRPGGRCQ